MLVDMFEVDAAPGDRMLLCSDGLTGMLEDAAIEEILRTAPSPHAAVVRLIASANDAGGQDNITAVVVDVDGSSPVMSRQAVAPRTERVASPEPSRRWIARLAWVLAAVAIIAGAWYATYSYARAQAYVIDQGGVVAVYRGVPGSFAGVHLDWLASVTDITVSDLDPVTAARLRDGIRVDGIEPAFSLVATYRLQTETSSPEPTATP